MSFLCRIGLHRWKEHFTYRAFGPYVIGCLVTHAIFDFAGKRCTRCGKRVGGHAQL
jgi:hypothetical protein